MRMVMKMAAVSTISLLLLCCSAISSTDSEEKCDYFVATGANFTVPLGFARDKSDRLRWNHNTKIILDRKDGKFVEGKKELISEDGSLKLTNVIKSNAGSYIPEVLDKDGNKKGTFKVKVLCVMDPVPKPVVTHTCKKKTAVSEAQFTCKVHTTTNHTFAWLRNNNKEFEKEKGDTLTRQADQVKTDSFSCRVSNSVSVMTSEPVVQNCIVNKVASFFPDTLLGLDTWIFVGAGGGVVLLLIIIVIVCCVHTKQRKHATEGRRRASVGVDQRPA